MLAAVQFFKSHSARSTHEQRPRPTNVATVASLLREVALHAHVRRCPPAAHRPAAQPRGRKFHAPAQLIVLLYTSAASRKARCLPAAAAAQLTVRPYAMPAMYRFLAHFSFTWLLGKALVRSVSCGAGQAKEDKRKQQCAATSRTSKHTATKGCIQACWGRRLCAASPARQAKATAAAAAGAKVSTHTSQGCAPWLLGGCWCAAPLAVHGQRQHQQPLPEQVSHPGPTTCTTRAAQVRGCNPDTLISP